MKCRICGKGPNAGNNVSHSHVKTRRTWKPNVQKILVDHNGKISRIPVCTQCLKSGKVRRPQKISKESITSSQIA